jgi:hypothetical protein
MRRNSVLALKGAAGLENVFFSNRCAARNRVWNYGFGNDFLGESNLSQCICILPRPHKNKKEFLIQSVKELWAWVMKTIVCDSAPVRSGSSI